MAKQNIGDTLKKLEQIVAWFENQEEADVEAGLAKVREGARLITAARERLKRIENEFEEVKKGIEKQESQDDGVS